MIHHWQATGTLDEGFLGRHAQGREPLLEAAQGWTLESAAAEARLPEADLRRLADTFAASSPAVVRCGWGVERNRNGGAAAAAIMAMPALLGKFGVAGGGFTMSNNGGAKVDREALLGTPKWQTRVVNMTRLAEALDSAAQRPIKALFVYNCNPVATVPDQLGILKGLGREDPVYGGLGAGDDGYGPLRRCAAAGNHLLGTTRDSSGLWELCSGRDSAGDRSGRGVAHQYRDFRCPGPRHGLAR